MQQSPAPCATATFEEFLGSLDLNAPIIIRVLQSLSSNSISMSVRTMMLLKPIAKVFNGYVFASLFLMHGIKHAVCEASGITKICTKSPLMSHHNNTGCRGQTVLSETKLSIRLGDSCSPLCFIFTCSLVTFSIFVRLGLGTKNYLVMLRKR